MVHGTVHFVHGVTHQKQRERAPDTGQTDDGSRIARTPVAPSPILVGRRFLPAFRQKRGLFLCAPEIKMQIKEAELSEVLKSI
jgi:hypothetical protein